MPSSLTAGDKRHVGFAINATDLSAGTPQYIYSPFDGYISEIETVIQTVIVTGGVIKVQLSSIVDGSDAIAALADVPGAAVTVANAAEAGFRQNAVATAGTTTRKVSKGDLIAINVDAAFNGGGAVSGYIVINVTQDVSPQAGYKTPSGG